VSMLLVVPCSIRGLPSTERFLNGLEWEVAVVSAVFVLEK
jgi:hypothetical protein